MWGLGLRSPARSGGRRRGCDWAGARAAQGRVSSFVAVWCASLLGPDPSLRLGQGLPGRGPCGWPGGPRSRPVMPVSRRGSRNTEALREQPGPTGLTPAQPGRASWRPARRCPYVDAQGGSEQKLAAEGTPASPSPKHTQQPAQTRAQKATARRPLERAQSRPPRRQSPAGKGAGVETPERRPTGAHMSTKTMKHQPRPPTSSTVTRMP